MQRKWKFDNISRGEKPNLFSTVFKKGIFKAMDLFYHYSLKDVIGSENIILVG